jgi:hypothetical protein
VPGARATRRLRWVLGLIGVAVVCLAIYTGYQAIQAKTALGLVADDFQTLGDQLKDGDGEAARATLERTQQHAKDAHDNTQGPGWWITARLPAVGDDVQAVRTVADVADVLSRDVLPPVVDASEVLKPSRLRPVKGRVDLEPIARVAPSVVQANQALQEQAARVARIRTKSLTSQLASPVKVMQAKVAEAADLSDRASRAVRLLPPMLGQDGRRTYLLLFQNNAEIRTTGGIPGAFAVITANHGRVSMAKQGDAGTMGRFDRPVLPLTKAEKRLFDPKMAMYPQDVNFTPDFPRSAQLIRAMWAKSVGEQVDGVMSTDPVALSYMLRGTGPVKLPGGGALTADNAVRLLLSDIYAGQPDPDLQNKFFAGAARSVFDAVSAGRGEPQQVLEGLSQAAGERRLLVWSSHQEEQRILEPTNLSGDLPTKDTDTPRVGIYFNDGTAAKLNYYMDYEASVESTSCQADRQRLRVTLKVRSDVPANASTLPDYVLGLSTAQGSPGTMRTTMFFYAPVDGHVDKATVDGREAPAAEYVHQGRQLLAQSFDLEPGQEHTFTFEVVTGEGQTSEPVLRITPGVHGDGIGSISRSACS